MTFWERYEKLCIDAGYKPGSEQAAQVLGTNRGTISAWKKSGNPPTPDILARIADAYGVSTDYLLCRTDDPIDYSNPELIAELAGAQLDALDGDVKRRLPFREQARKTGSVNKLHRGKGCSFTQSWMKMTGGKRKRLCRGFYLRTSTAKSRSVGKNMRDQGQRGYRTCDRTGKRDVPCEETI